MLMWRFCHNGFILLSTKINSTLGFYFKGLMDVVKCLVFHRQMRFLFSHGCGKLFFKTFEGMRVKKRFKIPDY